MRWLRDYQHREDDGLSAPSDATELPPKRSHIFREGEECDVYVHNAQGGVRLDFPGLRNLGHVYPKQGEDFEFVDG
jgi:hypothetical protein